LRKRYGLAFAGREKDREPLKIVACGEVFRDARELVRPDQNRIAAA
jgi:hypothetical protein